MGPRSWSANCKNTAWPAGRIHIGYPSVNGTTAARSIVLRPEMPVESSRHIRSEPALRDGSFANQVELDVWCI